MTGLAAERRTDHIRIAAGSSVLRRGGDAGHQLAVAMAGSRVLHLDALVRAADRRNPRPEDRARGPGLREHRHRLVQGKPQPQAASHSPGRAGLGDEVVRYAGHAPDDDMALLVVYRDGAVPYLPRF
jgi:hypothetical protein